MDRALEVAVAIVNYNTCDHLRACLDSVLQTGAREVLVADNASSDGSAEMVRARFPAVHLLQRPVNDGYGAGANAAIARCRAPYVLLLNSDTILHPDALRALFCYLHAHPQTAVLGPRLVNPDGSTQRSAYPAPSALATLIQESHLQQLVQAIPPLRRRYLLLPAGSVSWALGAALAMRRDAFLTVGGFDESFFMYFEEVDLCYRLRAAGWEVHFAPVTDVIHVGGASTRQSPAPMCVQLYLSQLHFARKHFSLAQRAALLSILVYIVLRNYARDTLRLRRASQVSEQLFLRAALKAWHDVLRRLVTGEGVTR